MGPPPAGATRGSASKAFCCHSAVYASDERLSTLSSIYSPDVGEGYYRQFITSKAACVWGEDVIPYLPRYKPGILVANSDTSQIGSDIETAIVDMANRVQAATRKRRSPAPSLTNMAVPHSVPGSRNTPR